MSNMIATRTIYLTNLVTGAHKTLTNLVKIGHCPSGTIGIREIGKLFSKCFFAGMSEEARIYLENFSRGHGYDIGEIVQLPLWDSVPECYNEYTLGQLNEFEIVTVGFNHVRDCEESENL